VAFLRARDPELVSVKRSVLAAVVVPSIFAIARATTSDAQVPLFASFGAFALMLFVSIPGTRSDKLRHYLALIASAALLIVAGSLCSNDAALAIAGMAVAGFVVLFAGVLSPTAALGSTYLLLAFVLPVNVPVPPGEIPARLAGWGWPRPRPCRSSCWSGPVPGTTPAGPPWPRRRSGWPAWCSRTRRAIATRPPMTPRKARCVSSGRISRLPRTRPPGSPPARSRWPSC
jgi:hypothetical protein